MSLKQTIWREDDRIRRTDGTGYGDRVSDAEIHKHLADHGADPLFAAFARAVLAIREFERITAVPVVTVPVSSADAGVAPQPTVQGYADQQTTRKAES